MAHTTWGSQSLADGQCKTLGTLTLSVPGTGRVVVSGVLEAAFGHTAGDADVLLANVETATPVTCAPSTGSTIHEIPDTIGSTVAIDQTVPVMRMFPVDAGATTFRVTAVGSNAAAGDAVQWGQATAVFYPD
jgi:hypothetical protein